MSLQRSNSCIPETESPFAAGLQRQQSVNASMIGGPSPFAAGLQRQQSVDASMIGGPSPFAAGLQRQQSVQPIFERQLSVQPEDETGPEPAKPIYIPLPPSEPVKYIYVPPPPVNDK